MQAALQDRYAVTAELKRGSGGVFQVVVDGKTIFDKHQALRFPEHQEIFEAIDRLTLPPS